MYQGQKSEILVKLTLAGLPAQDLLASDVAAVYWKPGQVTFMAHPILPQDWTSLGAGYYALKLPSDLFDVIGPFWLRLSGISIDTLDKELFVEVAPAS